MLQVCTLFDRIWLWKTFLIRSVFSERSIPNPRTMLDSEASGLSTSPRNNKKNILHTPLIQTSSGWAILSVQYVFLYCGKNLSKKKYPKAQIVMHKYDIWPSTRNFDVFVNYFFTVWYFACCFCTPVFIVHTFHYQVEHLIFYMVQILKQALGKKKKIIS